MDKAITKASSKDVIVIPDDDDVNDHASSPVTHKALTVYSPERKSKISEKKNENVQRFGGSNRCGFGRQWKD